MKYGEKLGCHQRPERSFFIKGYQLPVCARCTGSVLGYLIAVPSFFLCGFSWLFSFVGCAAMLIDWGLQALHIKASTNQRRLITGLLGGYGLMSLQLMLIKLMIKLLLRK
jgi:uncharacterized membrane protein